MKNIKIGVMCEESQEICKAFRKRGFETYSCDLKPCSGGHPEWHFQANCIDIIPLFVWDLIIFHPDCTAMAVSGNRWYGTGMKWHYKRLDAINWTLMVWNLICKHSKSSVLENPVSVVFSTDQLKNPQYIQPWMFGHGETKKTGLKLRNLPELKPTNIVSGRENRIWKMPPSADRKELRSKTYPGIAEAMAVQFGNYLTEVF